MNFIRILFIFLFAILLSSCNSLKEDVSGVSSYDDIKVVRVEHKDFRRFHGYTKSQLTSLLSFQTEGRIIFMPYTRGDFIKKGQVLARLDGILYKIKKDEEQAALKEAEIEHAKSKNYYKRMDILHKSGAISDNDWEDAYFALQTNGEKVKIQREKLLYLDKEISYNIITAPYDGFVVKQLSQIGSYAKVGEPVIEVSGSNATQVEVMVDSDVVSKLNIEKKVEVECQNKSYEGKIAHISQTSLKDGGYLVKIYLNRVYDELKDGMACDVGFSFDSVKCAYVPLESVFEEKSEKYIYKIVNIKNNVGEIKKEQIKTGEINNNKIEILSGLENSEYVATGNIQKIKPNSRIRI